MKVWPIITLVGLLREVKCRLKLCPGHVVSGIHKREIWIGWQCEICGRVKYYAPTEF